MSTHHHPDKHTLVLEMPGATPVVARYADPVKAERARQELALRYTNAMAEVYRVMGVSLEFGDALRRQASTYVYIVPPQP